MHPWIRPIWCHRCGLHVHGAVKEGGDFSRHLEKRYHILAMASSCASQAEAGEFWRALVIISRP